MIFLFFLLFTVVKANTCSCLLGYRNGAKSTDKNLCMGPAERGKRPCYPAPCNADWTPCTTQQAEDNDLWTKDTTHTGKRPDCPKVKINNAGENYFWNTLDTCFKKCINEPTGKCNMVSRYGESRITPQANFHCRFYACPDPNNFQWVTQDQWGNDAASSNTYILYLDKNINSGKFDTKPARTAPAPMLTINAGRAQHSKVPRLVNKVINGIIIFFLDSGFNFIVSFFLFQ